MPILYCFDDYILVICLKSETLWLCLLSLKIAWTTGGLFGSIQALGIVRSISVKNAIGILTGIESVDGTGCMGILTIFFQFVNTEYLSISLGHLQFFFFY